jgi:hypothetical protein
MITPTAKAMEEPKTAEKTKPTMMPKTTTTTMRRKESMEKIRRKRQEEEESKAGRNVGNFRQEKLQIE